MAFFEGNKMTAGYGNGPDIIKSCSLKVDKGEIVALLGPNGAGEIYCNESSFGFIKFKVR